MDGSHRTARIQLEREVSSLLSCWDPDLVERLDAVLADCAAEALRLSVECLRADRKLHAALELEAASTPATGPHRELFLQRKRLAAERSRIEGLMRSLRLHRDRVAPRGPSRP